MEMPPRLEYTLARLNAIRKAFGPLAKKPIFTPWGWKLRGDKWQKQPAFPAGKEGVTLAEVLSFYKSKDFIAGVGVKLGPVPGTKLVLFGVDYDGAAKGPLPAAWPKSKTYRERSPSGGDKFHLLGIHKGAPLEGKRDGAVEVYCDGRFFTLTGERIGGATILETDPLPYYAAIGVREPKPYGARAESSAQGAPIDEEDLTPREKELLEAVRGMEDDDESKRDYKVCAELVARGATDDEAARVLCAGFWRAKLGRKDYLGRTLAKAREDAPDVERAREFRKESRGIGEGDAEANNYAPMYTLEMMLAECVFIADGSQVALRGDPRSAHTFGDFENLTAASVVHTGQKGRPATVAKLWLKHPQRETVQTRTFLAGGPLFCQSPNYVAAINTWREPPRATLPADWRERAKPFLDHAAFLVPVRAELEFFLDWLAHIEQRPGVLPHIHVLMYTPRHGIGRNLLTSVLARAWAGVVALDVDLRALLNGTFNGRLSRKLFAVVNEVREGGANPYSNAENLKKLLTDEQRRINPKYGREYDEFNAVRWLMFSNHESALPLDRFDRRIYAIKNPDKARPADYYVKLYAMAADPKFAASVREVLRRRDISRFNPGMHAPLTETKLKVIEASMSPAELAMKDVAADYAGDCITSDALGSLLWGADSHRRERAALRYIAPRADAQKYRERVRIRGIQQHVWILRNYDRWKDARPDAIAREVERGEKKEAKHGKKF